MKKHPKLPTVSRVAPGARAVVDIPVGPTYEHILLRFTAAAGLGLEDINRIDVLIGGTVKQTFKNAARLVSINAYYNRDTDTVTATEMVLGIHFNRAELADNVWRSAPGIGTQDVATFSIEFDVDAAAPASIACTAWAQVNPVQQPLGVFTSIREFPANAVSAGVYEHDKLPRGAWYPAIHLYKPDISYIEVEANGVKVIENPKAILERFQKGATPRARVPQTAQATHIDFMLEGVLADTLPTAGLQDFRVKATCDTNGAFDIVAETLDTITA